MTYSNLFEWWYTEKAKWTVNEWNKVSDWLSSTRGYWDPYYAGRHPIRADDPQYKFNQFMAGVSPTYGSLYRAGSEASFLSDYGHNRGWNYVVTYPGMSSYGGWQSVGYGTRIVSENIKRLYR